MAAEMDMVELGDISIDGTKVNANASKHKAMSWDRACQLEEPPGGEEQVSLKALQEINDPYEIGTFDKFFGRFEYDYDEEGFLPVYKETEGTQVIKQIWDQIESKRVHKAWSQARKYVSDPKGDEPKLIYDEESCS